MVAVGSFKKYYCLVSLLARRFVPQERETIYGQETTKAL